MFTFAFANGFLTVPAGPASQNGFCTFDGVLPVGMEVTISEAVPASMRVSAITVTPADRLVGAPDLAGGRVVLRVGEDINEVTFTTRSRRPRRPPRPR